MTTSCEDKDPIPVIQGASKKFLLIVTSLDDGSLQDLTDPFQIWSALREHHESPTPLIQKRTANAGGSTQQIAPFTPQSGTTNGVLNKGRAFIYWTPADTAQLKVGKIYYFSVWGVPPTGEHNPIVDRRRIIIEPRYVIIP